MYNQFVPEMSQRVSEGKRRKHGRIGSGESSLSKRRIVEGCGK